MRKLSRKLAGFALFGALVACGAPGAGETDTDRSAAQSAEAAPPMHAPPAGLTPEEVRRMLAEDDALAAEDARLYEMRRASMAGYDDCMAQATAAPDGARQRIEEACGRLLDAPR
jgi:hypothetical protein